MELKVTFEHENLHNDLGISDERNNEIKEQLKAIALNCMENGIVTLDNDNPKLVENGIMGVMGINLAKIIYETAKVANTPEELVMVVLYHDSVKRTIEHIFKDIGDILPNDD
jgi:hypothetical protein